MIHITEPDIRLCQLHHTQISQERAARKALEESMGKRVEDVATYSRNVQASAERVVKANIALAISFALAALAFGFNAWSRLGPTTGR